MVGGDPGGAGGVWRASCHHTELYQPNVKRPGYLFTFFSIVCFTSYFVFSIAVIPYNPRVVYYNLFLRR